MKENIKFFILIVLVAILIMGSILVYENTRSAKIKVAISNLTTLCYSINAYHKKNGILPEASEELPKLVFDQNNVDVYAKDFLSARGNDLKYSRLSDQKYEIFYAEKDLLFKLPDVFCNSDREGKNISSGLACNCSLVEY